MASITGLSNQNYVSSLYNSSKTISGLASGLDTESMIESLTQSYQKKITQLQQKSTKIEWKQEAYRSAISKMYSFSNKYTSYTSSTNLMSQSFWNSARTSSVSGKYADKVSASGTTSSDIQLNSVSQLATSARYATSGNFSIGGGNAIQGEKIDLTKTTEVNALQGSLTLTYGNKTVSVVFTESDKIEAQEKADGTMETADEALARVISEKLGEETISTSGGSSVAANERINVEVKNGEISFSDKSSAGNSVYISGGSGAFESVVPEKPNTAKASSFKVPESGNEVTNADGVKSFFRKDELNIGKISGKSMNINLDGTTKKITMPAITKNDDGTYSVGERENVNENDLADVFTEELENAIQNEFGDKIKVTNEGSGGELKLNFEVAKGSDLLINTDAGDALGIGKIASNYLSTGKTLEELGVDFSGLTPSRDKNGNVIAGKYDFEINGKVIGSYDKNTTLSTIMGDINSKSDVKVSYSKTSREFVFTSKDTGAHTKVEFGDGLAKTMFGTNHSDKFAENYGLNLADGETKNVTFDIGGQQITLKGIGNGDTMESIAKKLKSKSGYDVSYNETSGQLIVTDDTGKMVDITASADGKEIAPNVNSSYTAGRDAKFNVTVNGREMELTRSSNKAEIDGLTINFKSTFETKEDEEAVSFQNTVKSDKVVDEVKNMVAELNVLLSELRGGYATMPAQKSNGAMYDPLTDDDMSGMSETSIKNYEEKAKQGLLFADSNISGLYNNLVSVFNRAGMDRTMMDKMGIGISYDTNGAATITLQEDKLREALESDFDGVVDMFTRSKENGAATDGIMQGIKTQMDRYGATTGAVKGILVQQAGTPLASLSLLDNGWQKEIDNYSSQITKWQEKLEKQVDRYTKLFTRLETLTNQMNSQSSALAGLMGG